MAGVLGGQMAQGAQPEAPAEQVAEGEEQQQMTPQQMAEEAGKAQPEEPTPEEQEAFDRVEAAATSIIHKDKAVSDNILKMLEAGSDNPPAALARAGLMVFNIVDEKANGNIPEEIILRGAEVTLDLVIELAEATGTMEVSEEIANQAMREMIVQAGELYDFDTTQLQEAMAIQSGAAPTGGEQNGVTG